MLQQIAKIQLLYVANNAQVKKELMELTITPRTLIFSADARSMYTGIPTELALRIIGEYLQTHQSQFSDLLIEALTKALTIIMRNNVVAFGDTFWHQQKGTAMGTPLEPPYATLFFAIKENSLIPNYKRELTYYKRYLDEILVVWEPHLPTEQDL